MYHVNNEELEKPFQCLTRVEQQFRVVQPMTLASSFYGGFEEFETTDDDDDEYIELGRKRYCTFQCLRRVEQQD